MKYVKAEEVDAYFIKNYNKIVESTVLDGSDINAIKTRKSIDSHFVFSLFGIHVLSMSKRIMNEVVCLAEEMGCQIFYTDTDSLHIRHDNIPKLESEFKVRYNKELRGDQLG